MKEIHPWAGLPLFRDGGLHAHGGVIRFLHIVVHTQRDGSVGGEHALETRVKEQIRCSIQLLYVTKPQQSQSTVEF